MRKVENAVWESHDYVSCQEQTSKCKNYQKSEEMSIKNIVTMSHSRILKQQRCCLRKHLNKLSKQWVIQESTQVSYWNDENVEIKNIK